MPDFSVLKTIFVTPMPQRTYIPIDQQNYIIKGTHPAMAEQGIVIGVFQDRQTMRQALQALQQAGFSDEQLGFAARHHAIPTEHSRESFGAIARGIVGGILGAADILLAPITGPSDATNILQSILPMTEEAIDRLPYPTSHGNTAPHASQTPPSSPDANTSETPITQQTSTPDDGESQKADERTSIITGGLVGGVAGAGAAALFIPGLGLAIAGGILAATLGGAALGGIAGGFLGAFTRIGVPEPMAHHYEQEIKAGKMVVTVKAAERQQEALSLLRQYGAHDIQAH